MIIRLTHLCFYSDQVQAMIAFYRDGLGLPVQFVMNGRDGEPFGWYFNLGETTFLEIFDQVGATREWGGDVVSMKSAAVSRYRHFCIQVSDMDMFREDLIGKGIAVGEISVGMDHSKQCWIKDPDGNDIEFMEYTEESLQLKASFQE